VTALAGAGHVILTSALGLLIVGLGIELDKRVGHWFPFVAGGVLVAFGLYHLDQQRRGSTHNHGLFTFGKKHCHEDFTDTHDHLHGMSAHKHSSAVATGHAFSELGWEPRIFEAASGVSLAEVSKRKKVVSDKATILGLLTMLTFSPCEGFLPVYLSGISLGWMGFIVLSLILAIATLAGMMAFTMLTLAGMEKLKLTFLEKYENALTGIVLCILGVAVTLLEH
jgi:ABC-type nickel/cobalt efflux system permease component RcnA